MEKSVWRLKGLFLITAILMSAPALAGMGRNGGEQKTILGQIDKGFLANPWGTKINELVDGSSLITDPAQRASTKKLTCTYAHQQGPEKALKSC